MLGTYPSVGTIAKDLRRHIRKPRGQLGLELSILLIQRRLAFGIWVIASLQTPLGGEIPVLGDLAVVDHALAANPLVKRDLHRLVGSRTEFHAGLVAGVHARIIYKGCVYIQ